MAMYAQILSAIFALTAASLWLGAALVRTPRNFSVQVTTWHTHNSENIDGSETAGGGHGTSDELETLGRALAWQSRLNASAAASAALSTSDLVPQTLSWRLVIHRLSRFNPEGA